jgi:hypothetical protein
MSSFARFIVCHLLLLCLASASEPAIPANGLLSQNIRELQAEAVQLDANIAISSARNMAPHPEIYLRAPQKSITWDGQIGDVELIQITQLSKLRELRLRGEPVTARGLQHLAKNQALEVILIDAARPLSDESVRGWDQLSELTELEIGPVDWSSEALKSLAAAPKLRQLTITGGRLAPQALQGVLKAKSLTILKLQKLDLRGTGVEQLGELKLGNLGVMSCTLGEAEIQAIGKLTTLQHLDANQATIRDGDLSHWLKLTSLASIGLNGSDVTLDGLRLLRALPKLRWHDYEGPADGTPKDYLAVMQLLANEHDWTFQGVCSCGCCDITPQPKMNARVVAPQ